MPADFVLPSYGEACSEGASSAKAVAKAGDVRNFMSSFSSFVLLLLSNKYITFACMKYSDLFKLLKMNGWSEVRQKGSHIIMQHPTNPNRLTVPFHAGKEVKTGLLKAILKQADIKTSKR